MSASSNSKEMVLIPMMNDNDDKHQGRWTDLDETPSDDLLQATPLVTLSELEEDFSRPFSDPPGDDPSSRGMRSFRVCLASMHASLVNEDRRPGVRVGCM